MIKKVLIFFGLFMSIGVALAADSVTSISEKQLLRRVFMLEYALAPVDPTAVATAWAQAAKNRNGAVQYMLLCPNLQKANLSNLNGLNWVTGVSSPSVSAYKIIPQGKSGNAANFTVQYQFLLIGSTKVLTAVDRISVVRTNPKTHLSQQWCINQFHYLSPVDGFQKK